MKGYLTTSIVLMVACSGDKSLTVQNPAPTADIISHDDGSEILEGFAITLEGVVSDSNHTPDQLTTRWVINGEVVCDDIIPDEDGSTFCETVLDTDETEISLEVRDAEQKFGEDTINVVIVETEAPIVEIITPMSDGVYYSDQLITFEGLVSDAEDDPELLVAYWESNVDGVLSDVDGEVSTSGEVLGYGTLSEGQHAIELHVEDTMQKSSTESVVITVGPPNSAPLCEILAPEDGAAGSEGELVAFEGMASDVDVAADWLSVTWTSDKDGEIGTSTPTSDGDISFSFANLSVNTHTITMKVMDEIGATCSKAIDYTVGTAPSIIIEAPLDGDVINEGTPITFSATVSDSQDQPDVIALDWVVDGNSISTQGATSSGEATFSDSSLTYGTYNLVVTATDTEGLTDSDQINFTVNGVPTAPVISISPDPATTSVGLSVSIDSPSVDPEGTIPTYTYEWQLGGQAQTSYTTSSLPSSVTTKGEQWTVVVTPNDGMTDGTSASASIMITNTAPSLSGLSITPTGTVYNDDVLTCAATVTDPDESPVPTFEWTVGGSVIGSSATLDLSTTGVLPDDVVTCTVSVVDSDGAAATDTISQTVSNRDPILSNTMITPSSGITTDTLLLCETTVADDDGESLTPTYSWTIGANSYTGDSLQLDSTMVNPGDTITCTADVVDGYGGNATDSVSVSADNTDPVISDVSITYSGDLTSVTMLTCEYTATDADNQALTPSYVWTNLSTNTPFSSTADTLQLSPTDASPNDVVECSVTVTDTSNGTDTVATTDTVLNTDPTFSSNAVITTTGTQVGDTWTCSASGTDQDDGTLTPTYEWMDVNGNVIGSGDTLVLSSSNSTPTEDITCVATITDSLNVAATSNASETVTNTLPVISASITANGTSNTGELTCSAIASDADDSNTPAITYEWFNSNGSLGSSNPLQLDASMGVDGDSIDCIAIATDLSGDTASATATHTITNTNPVISDVSITYSGDLTSVTLLTCEYTASDADNQALTPSYVWTNLSTNTQFVSTASTVQLDPSMVGPTNIVECSVTVTDTSGGTDTVAASDTVLNTDPTFISNAVITTTGTQVGDTWTCSANGTDQDDGTLTPTYEWMDVNGNVIGSGDTLVLSSTNSNPTEDITCVATITDSLGVTAASSASETVTNTTPVFDVSASITPNTGVTTSSSLQCSGTASDSDGDTPTLTYVWTNSSGTTYGSTSDTLQLTVSTVLPSDVVSCTITATDDQGDTVSSSASVTVDNTLPSITASITANGSTNTGELTCSATASDVDDSTTPTITYEWFNTAGSLGTSNPLTLDSSMGVDGDTIDCTATATDLSGGTSSDTATHTITNTPPVIDSVALSPSTIDVSTSSVTCVVSSSDADGDPVTESFEWYVDGNLQSETTNMYSGPFIVGTLLACRTTPNDGKTDGDFAEDTATIQNTLPAVDSVTLSPSTVYTNDTITAAAVLSDGDSSQSGSLTANYEWFVDNASVQNGSSNTLDGVSMFERDQTVYVTVTPNDGVEDGSPLSSGSIVVSNTAPTAPSVSVGYGVDSVLASFETPLSWSAAESDCANRGGNLAWIDSESVNDDVYSVCSSCNFTTGKDGCWIGLSSSDWTTWTSGETRSYTNWYPGNFDGSGSAAWMYAAYGKDGYWDDTAPTPNRPYVCRLPTDGDLSGAVATIEIMGEDLICSIDSPSTDDDGDSIVYTYDWSDSNGSQQTTIEVSDTSDVFLASGLTADTWTCDVTPYDGTDYGTSTTAEGTVESSCGLSTPTLNAGLSTLATVAPNPIWGPSQITTEWWVNFHDTSIDDQMAVSTAWDDSSTGGWFCNATPTGVNFKARYATLSSQLEYSYDFNQDQWYHVACAYDGTEIAIFINGRQMASHTYTGGLEYNNSNLILFHRNKWVSIATKNHSVRDIRISNASIYSTDFIPAWDITVQSNTIALFKVDEGTGSSLQSTVGNYSASLTGSYVWDVSGEFCDFLDADGDGYAAWEDCDDNDASIYENCPPSYCVNHAGSNGHPYLVCASTTHSWTEALAVCESYDKSLWTINSAGEENDLRSVIASQFSGHMWIGYQDIDGDGIWEWANGEQTSYTNWHPGNGNAGYCGQMQSPDHSHYQWSELSASNGDCYPSQDSWMDGTIHSGGFVCEGYTDADGDGYAAWEDCDDNDASVPNVNDADCDGVTVSAGDCDDSDASIYPFAGDTYGDGIDSDCDGLDCEAGSDGSTYFAACGYQSTLSDAQSLCISAGYDGLATIQNASESSYIVSLFTNQTSNWTIGLVDSTGNDDWYWRSGMTMSYTNWTSGQPQVDAGRDCGFMYASANGEWYNDSCSISVNGGGVFGRICENANT